MESPWVKAGLRLLVTLEMGELLVNRITGWYGMQGLEANPRVVAVVATERELCVVVRDVRNAQPFFSCAENVRLLSLSSIPELEPKSSCLAFCNGEARVNQIPIQPPPGH